MTPSLVRDGYIVFPVEDPVLRWAQAAHEVACSVLNRRDERRHGGTWFVGVDALPNALDGSISGIPLAGSWLDHIDRPAEWHRAQLSVVFPGYPQRDADESEAAHRYRRNRDAAHVDGLLPEGPDRRRHLREPHGFVAGLPLNTVTASPLVVWRGSHAIMQSAFRAKFAGVEPKYWGDMDVTDVYQQARRTVFAACHRQPLAVAPGQVVLLHRHLLHGVAPWGDTRTIIPRMIAYFRPVISPADWL